MAKYYIQSGKVSYTVSACDAEGAALWVMHRIMDVKICEFESAQSEWDAPMPDDDMLADLSGMSSPRQQPHDASYRLSIRADSHDEMEIPQAIPYDAMLEGLAEFAETIQISERGLGHTDAGELETEEIFHQWRQLMLAVDRLHDEMG